MEDVTLPRHKMSLEQQMVGTLIIYSHVHGRSHASFIREAFQRIFISFMFFPCVLHALSIHASRFQHRTTLGEDYVMKVACNFPHFIPSSSVFG